MDPARSEESTSWQDRRGMSHRVAPFRARRGGEDTADQHGDRPGERAALRGGGDRSRRGKGDRPLRYTGTCRCGDSENDAVLRRESQGGGVPDGVGDGSGGGAVHADRPYAVPPACRRAVPTGGRRSLAGDTVWLSSSTRFRGPVGRDAGRRPHRENWPALRCRARLTQVSPAHCVFPDRAGTGVPARKGSCVARRSSGGRTRSGGRGR